MKFGGPASFPTIIHPGDIPECYLLPTVLSSCRVSHHFGSAHGRLMGRNEFLAIVQSKQPGCDLTSSLVSSHQRKGVVNSENLG